MAAIEAGEITTIFVHIQEHRVPRHSVSRYCYWSRLSKGICYVYCFSFAPSSKRRSRGPTSLLHSALRYPRLVNRSLFPRFFPAFSGARFFNGSIEPRCILSHDRMIFSVLGPALVSLLQPFHLPYDLLQFSCPCSLKILDGINFASLKFGRRHSGISFNTSSSASSIEFFQSSLLDDGCSAATFKPAFNYEKVDNP